MRSLCIWHFDMLIPVQMDEQNLFKWRVGLWVVNPDSVFYGAYLRVSSYLLWALCHSV